LYKLLSPTFERTYFRPEGRRYFLETIETIGSSLLVNPKNGFAVPHSELRTEGGRRQESEGCLLERMVDDPVCSKVLAVSLAHGSSGNGKIVRQEQPGEPTQMKPNHLPVRSGSGT